MASEVDRFKNGFFDRGIVKDAMSEAARKGMMRTGGYIRKVARNSMKKALGPSAPNSPPNVHVGLLKNLLFFAYDAARNSVVVGPVALGSSDVPKVLEFSGRGIEKRPYMKPAQDASLSMLAPSIRFGN